MRPSIITPTVITTMKCLNKKVLKCLWTMKEVDIGILRPATINQVISEVTGIGILRPTTLTLLIAEDIIVVMLVEVDLGQKIPATLTLEIF